jgi:hypothetical protein
LLGGCLGRDYLDQPVSLSEWDHGWLSVIDPGEELSVTLMEHPGYPGAAWRVLPFDETVLTLNDSFSEVHPRVNPDEQQSLLRSWVFVFTGANLGETPLGFEVRADGELVDVAEFTVAVTEDACESSVGLSAARCQSDQPDENHLGWTEWDDGLSFTAEPGDEITVELTANPLYPKAAWEIAQFDTSVLAVESLGTGATRTPGDWDVTDNDKPRSFLPISKFIVTPVGPGPSPLVFELGTNDEAIEVVAITVTVADDR